VGGSGERKTLRLVARYADACNLFAPDQSVVAHKLDVLARHCEVEGRDPAAIEKTIISDIDPLADVGAFLAAMAEYGELGVEMAWVSPRGPDPAAWAEQVSEQVVPALGDL
jgi:alkanesulfonate monooxygenase SsuD/methylene tetrahydromethanopterin reductase-like flavin-dependent oxidoreductase (luciferase family)